MLVEKVNICYDRTTCLFSGKADSLSDTATDPEALHMSFFHSFSRSMCLDHPTTCTQLEFCVDVNFIILKKNTVEQRGPTTI
jgi:hypothetical protein